MKRKKMQELRLAEEGIYLYIHIYPHIHCIYHIFHIYLELLRGLLGLLGLLGLSDEQNQNKMK